MPAALPAYSLRPATATDEDFLFALYASTRQNELAAWGWPPAQCAQFLQLQFRAQRQTYLAAYPASEHSIILLAGTPAGGIWVHRADSIRLVDIALLPEFQNRGLGSQLIRELLSAGKPVELSVLQSNVRAIQLYLRLGFAIVADDGVYLRMTHKPLTSAD